MRNQGKKWNGYHRRIFFCYETIHRGIPDNIPFEIIVGTSDGNHEKISMVFLLVILFKKCVFNEQIYVGFLKNSKEFYADILRKSLHTFLKLPIDITVVMPGDFLAEPLKGLNRNRIPYKNSCRNHRR